MTIVSFRPAAVRDLDAITDHSASDNPVRALTFADELLDACLSLQDLPERGTPRDDLAEGVRMLVHGAYLILYDVIQDDADRRVEILRILHGRRSLSDEAIR